ncbi:MAG: hypothetical protein ACXVDD_11605 [Polyangia bacterium]
MRRTVLATLLVLLATIARADAHDVVRVVPKVFDPVDRDRVFAVWAPPGVLELVKAEPTASLSAAGADVEGVAGMTLTELGFDSFDPGHCGAGAPRYNVTLEDGSLYFFGCAYGEHDPSPFPRFTRVRFGDTDAKLQYDTQPPWPGFGHAVVREIQIVFDEGIDQGPGWALLAAIDINRAEVRGVFGIAH